MNVSLLDEFADRIIQTPSTPLTVEDLHERFLIAEAKLGGRNLSLCYAPFDHVNLGARVVIVGLTPGARQAADAHAACGVALASGQSRAEALRLAKGTASFSGPMRRNLVRMLDSVGVADLLAIESTASLWDVDERLAHFTSAVRYPLFVDGGNWSGTPDAVAAPQIRAWLEAYTGPELALIPQAILVPLGPAVSRALSHFADLGFVRREFVLDGLPHPSGANAERIGCFLGDKPPELASSRTNGAALVAMRGGLRERIAKLAGSI